MLIANNFTLQEARKFRDSLHVEAGHRGVDMTSDIVRVDKTSELYGVKIHLTYDGVEKDVTIRRYMVTQSNEPFVEITNNIPDVFISGKADPSEDAVYVTGTPFAAFAFIYGY